MTSMPDSRSMDVGGSLSGYVKEPTQRLPRHLALVGVFLTYTMAWELRNRIFLYKFTSNILGGDYGGGGGKISIKNACPVEQ